MPPLGHIYGGGWHSSTRAALLSLSTYIKPNMTFAEIGAGSGIISVASKLLGAGSGYATELAPEALAALIKVFAANNITDVQIVNGTFPLTTVDLVIVSITSEWFKNNLQNIKMCLNPGGRIINVEDNSDLTIIVNDTSSTISAPHELLPVPKVVTMAQARRALKRAGLLVTIQTIVDASDDETSVAWDYGTNVHRNDQLVADMTIKLGLTETQMDNLFKQATTI